MFNNFFFRKSCFYEIMYKNMEEPERLQMQIRRTSFACWITKARHTHSEYVTQLFHGNSGCANAPKYYVIK